MKRKNKSDKIKLSPSDIEAIVCALPLVANFDAFDEHEIWLNTMNCNSAVNKLLNHNFKLDPNELRVISLAIAFALDVISGTGDAIVAYSGVDQEWRNNLSKFLFNYTRLDPFFARFGIQI